MRRIKIAAGLSACDFSRIGELVAEATEAGVDYIHIDAQDMRSHMPYLALMGGPQLVEGIRGCTDLPIEVHANVEGVTTLFVDAWVDAGANMIILPMEHYFGHKLAFLVERMKERNCKAGLTVSPGSPLCLVDQSIYWADRLVVYTRDVVTTGGPLRETALPVVRAAREMIDTRKLNCELCCDGGLNAQNLHKVIDAGADVLEFSREIFGTKDGILHAVKTIRQAIGAATGYKEKP